MTVAELIAKLNEFDGTLEVVTSDSEGISSVSINDWYNEEDEPVRKVAVLKISRELNWSLEDDDDDDED